MLHLIRTLFSRRRRFVDLSKSEKAQALALLKMSQKDIFDAGSP